MHGWHKVFLISFLLLSLGCSKDSNGADVNNLPDTNMGADPADDETPEVPSLEERIQSIIDTRVGFNKLVGVSMSVRVDGEERWSFTGGPVTKEMRFGIASITKTAVAASIMRLGEEGLLSIEDPISDYLSLNNPNVDPSITIYQLLTHQAGLRDYFVSPDIWPRVEGNLETAIPPMEIVDYIGEPLFSPGEQYEYSNANFLILGLVI
jgi:CubicO group peptidase (beta-lactamase class C family)